MSKQQKQRSSPKMIISLSKTEYITDDGEAHPILFELDDPLPSIQEFQQIYDEWFRLFQQKGLIDV